MPDIEKIPRFGRWNHQFSPTLDVDTVRLQTPSGEIVNRPTFDHQPAQFRYDHHGKADSWDRVLRDEQEAPIVEHLAFDFGVPAHAVTGFSFHPLWPNEEGALEVRMRNGDVLVDRMKYGVMIRLNY